MTKSFAWQLEALLKNITIKFRFVELFYLYSFLVIIFSK